VLVRCLICLSIAAILVQEGGTEAQAQPALPAAESITEPGADIDELGDGGDEKKGWHAVTGLRAEQWIVPTDDHLKFNVRLSLPEAGLGKRFTISTFSWERLDVAEGKKSNRGENGTVYQLLGARYRRDAHYYGFFVGAHLLTWSGKGRPVTPWLGLRLGPVDGPSIRSEARLMGLGPQGGELGSPLDDTEVSVAIDGPRLGLLRIGARGRARDVRHPDRHQREQMMSLGVEFGLGRKRMFLGVGVQHQERRSRAAEVPMPDRMDPGPSRINSTAVMVHLDAQSPLPRSILPD